MSVASLFTPCFVMFCVFLYGPFCHGAHKLDLSTLFTTFFLWTSPFIFNQLRILLVGRFLFAFRLHFPLGKKLTNTLCTANNCYLKDLTWANARVSLFGIHYSYLVDFWWILVGRVFFSFHPIHYNYIQNYTNNFNIFNWIFVSSYWIAQILIIAGYDILYIVLKRFSESCVVQIDYTRLTQIQDKTSRHNK